MTSTLLFVSVHVRPCAQSIALAAGSLVAALPEARRRCSRILDLYLSETPESMLESIEAEGASLVSFSLYSWNRAPILALCRELRQRCPELFIVLGGPEASADAEAVLLQSGADALIRGEGEQSFAQLLEFSSADAGPVPPGVLLRQRGEILDGGDRPVAPDFDALTSPWLCGALHPADSALWEISRGCPFSCDFCFDARGERGVRRIGQARLEAELDLFVRAGVSQIWVLDSTFNADPQGAKALLRLIAKKAPHIHFHLEAKADFLDAEMALLLGRISCSVQIGLQSLHAEVLGRVNRPFDRERFEERVRLLGPQGVTFGLDLIYGLPGDSFEGFCRSLDGALALEPNHLDIFPLSLLPGTELSRQAARYGLRAQPEAPYRVLETASCSAEDMERCRRLAASADIFHKAGRAAGFFSLLPGLVGLTAVEFFLRFQQWLEAKESKRFAGVLEGEILSAREALGLQQGFMAQLFSEAGKQGLKQALSDLLNYHFHFAETLIGPEPLPAGGRRKGRLSSAPCRLSPHVRLVDFSYPVEELLASQGQLLRFVKKNRPAASTMLFWRRAEQVFCEELDEEFVRLLRGSDGRRTPDEILKGRLESSEVEEIVRFALAEGFLVFAAS